MSRYVVSFTLNTSHTFGSTKEAQKVLNPEA